MVSREAERVEDERGFFITRSARRPAMRVPVATAELAQSQVLITASMAALAYATQQMTDQMSDLMESIDVTAE